MNAGMSRADSGESYLIPCFTDMDLRSPRARAIESFVHERRYLYCDAMYAPRAPSSLERAP
jgi:hypothetical protein